MRERRGGTEESHGITAKIHFGVRGADHAADFFSGHTFAQILKNQAVDIAGGFAGEAHELQFVRGLARAAGDGDGVGGNKIEAGSGSAEMVVKGEGQRFVDTDAASAQIALRQRRGDELRGTLVFLPDAHVEGIAHEFTHAGFFKGGRNEERLAGAQDDQGQEAFTGPPANAGEIVERRAGAEQDGVEVWVEGGHQFLRVKQAAVEFVGGDGMNAVAERLQCGERRRELRLRAGGRGGGERQ